MSLWRVTLCTLESRQSPFALFVKFKALFDNMWYLTLYSYRIVEIYVDVAQVGTDYLTLNNTTVDYTTRRKTSSLHTGNKLCVMPLSLVLLPTSKFLRLIRIDTYDKLALLSHWRGWLLYRLFLTAVTTKRKQGFFFGIQCTNKVWEIGRNIKGIVLKIKHSTRKCSFD